MTNDDGVSAPGIWAAATVLSKFGNVLIVAPSNNCSGFGTAFPPGQTQAYHLYHRPEGHPSNVTAYGLDLTPSACVHAALTGAFGDIAFDMVVSGINLGS
ncbi:MAG TPA: 5'/3'-nucleotidase SurE, partial [Anaerolineae bacterium]